MSSRNAYPGDWGGRGAHREVNVLPCYWISQPRWCFTQEKDETDPVRETNENQRAWKK